jgi:fucose permease
MTDLTDVQLLREQVRADRRTVTAPLVVFGILILGHVVVSTLVAAATGPAGNHLTRLVYWPLAGAVGLAALWIHAHRVAVRDGVGEGPRSYKPVTLGYVVSLPVIALLFIPVLFIGVFASLAWPAAVLLAIGIRQHSTTLKSVAKWLAAAGVLEALLAALSSVAADAAGWVIIGLEAAAGLALVTGALLKARRAATA